MNAIRLVGFDADDTLWRSQDYFDQAQVDFEAIVGRYVDLDSSGLRARMLATEQANLTRYGYGVKGMILSMVEAAIELSEGRIEARDIHRIMDLGKALLVHPVELLPGIAEAVDQVAARYRIVLITKGDLFHQEQKAPPSRRHAKNCKRLNFMNCALRMRRRMGRSCSPMGPDVSQNCHGFATVSGVA